MVSEVQSLIGCDCDSLVWRSTRQCSIIGPILFILYVAKTLDVIAGTLRPTGTSSHYSMKADFDLMRRVRFRILGLGLGLWLVVVGLGSRLGFRSSRISF